MLAASLFSLFRWPLSLIWLAVGAIALIAFAAIDERRRTRRAALEQIEQDAQERYREVLRRIETRGHGR